MYTQHIPASPPNVSVKENMAFIRQKFGRITGPIDYYWFYSMVRNKGSWDFKQQGKYEAFGNFHYGAVGYARGIPEQVLLRAAGCAQQVAGTSLDEYGSCWLFEPYGDDPIDQAWVQEGINYAKNMGY